MLDLEEEEEEWNRLGISEGDDSLAQGVTYDELSSVGALLQKENLEQAQKETAVAIVQQLQGPELFTYGNYISIIGNLYFHHWKFIFKIGNYI